MKTKTCNDKNCPMHGQIKTRGKTFKGVVISNKAQKSALVEWGRIKKIQKYERYEKLKTKIQVHNPECINAKTGDFVEIKECRPLSKTKKFVITKILNKEDKITEDINKIEKPKEKQTKKEIKEDINKIEKPKEIESKSKDKNK